jgi:hypothetical protein
MGGKPDPAGRGHKEEGAAAPRRSEAMPKLMIATAILPGLLLMAAHSGADEPKAESAQTVAAVEEKKEKEFTPPPGFRAKKRGGLVVYCRREEPRGTRFPAEVCYDEKGLRDLAQQQREDQQKVDQMRKVYGIITY